MLTIPTDFPVQPVELDYARSRRILGKYATWAQVHQLALTHAGVERPATCGTCGLTWDDGKITSMTPAPSARCPFEAFHNDEDSA